MFKYCEKLLLQQLQQHEKIAIIINNYLFMRNWHDQQFFCRKLLSSRCIGFSPEA